MRQALVPLAIATLTAADALAQPVGRPTSHEVRVVASVNGGWQAAERGFTDAFTFDRYLETADVKVAYRVRSGPVYEGGVSVRVWRALGVGLAVSSFTDRTAAAVAGSVPHPFFFERNRSIEGQTQVTHRQTGVHGQVVAFVRVGRRLLLTIGGGPSVIAVAQRFVTTVDYDEAYPYDEATFRRADTARATERRLGANAGADVAVRLGAHLGAGAIVRYTRADVAMKPGGGRSVALRGGGWQAGAGLRVLF